MSNVVSEERFAGCLLGEAVGDGVGAPYEGLSQENLFFGWDWLANWSRTRAATPCITPTIRR
jgi:ADP-ribosylglycohydrolase